MPQTIDDVLRALKNADAAGDVDAARQLAGLARRMAQPPVPEPQRLQVQERKVSPIESGVAGFARGATLGTIDEGAALLKSKVRGMPYDEALERTRFTEEQAQQQNPATFIGGELMGAIGTGLTTSQIPGVTVGRGVPLATAEGGAYGFATGEGSAAQRLDNAKLPAAVGAAAATTVPVIASSVRSMASPQNKAMAQLRHDLQREGVTPAQARQTLDDLGPEARLFDASKALTARAERANTVPAARDLIEPALESRRLGQGGRLVDVAGNLFKKQTTARAEVDALKSQARKTAAPFYDAAYEQPVPFTNTLEKLAARPSVKKALANAAELAREEGQDTLGQWFARFDGLGDKETLTELRQIPNMRVWDYIKRGLDDVVEGYRDKTSGRLVLDTRGNKVNDTRAQLRDELRKLNPLYAAALDNYAGPSQSADAILAGRKAFRQHPEDVAKSMQRLSPGDRQFFKLGFVDELNSQIAVKRDFADKATPFIRTPASRERLAVVFGDDAREIERVFLAESQMARNENIIGANSATARRMMADDETSTIGNAAVRLGTGALRGEGAVSNAMNTIANLLSRSGTNEKRAKMLAELLVSHGPQARVILDDVERNAIKNATSNEAQRALALTFGAPTPVLTNQLGQ